MTVCYYRLCRASTVLHPTILVSPNLQSSDPTTLGMAQDYQTTLLAFSGDSAWTDARLKLFETIGVDAVREATRRCLEHGVSEEVLKQVASLVLVDRAKRLSGRPQIGSTANKGQREPPNNNKSLDVMDIGTAATTRRQLPAQPSTDATATLLERPPNKGNKTIEARRCLRPRK